MIQNELQIIEFLLEQFNNKTLYKDPIKSNITIREFYNDLLFIIDDKRAEILKKIEYLRYNDNIN